MSRVAPGCGDAMTAPLPRHVPYVSPALRGVPLSRAWPLGETPGAADGSGRGSAYADRVSPSAQDTPAEDARSSSPLDLPPGVRLGLPESGSGSVAPWGPRIGAILLDALIAGLVAWLFTQPELPRNWSLLSFFAMYAVSSALFGRTLGMAALRLRLAFTKEGSSIGLPRAVLRTVMVMLLVPAVIVDRDRRGLQDRVTDTAVVRA